MIHAPQPRAPSCACALAGSHATLTHIAVTTLRYFFDTGAGVCLWREPGAEDCAVDLATLPLTANAVRLAEAAMALHDLRIDWSAPPAPGPYWDASAQQACTTLATRLLHVLRSELGAHGYHIIDAR